ncbi:hypothetical protein [Rhodococcus opacus]|uniref:Alpha/beta hydrolase n=1 Tax=Rhodococcus opacus TaxID=37919 RepID=A0A2S8JAV2_RHOOP|nr:hypothetical protein [Rhodococcus opacus]PQP24125.1 hypothetical protein C5613_14685 [Rhodococcus opacus]
MKATLVLRGLIVGAVVFGAVASVQPATASADTGTLLRLPASDSNVGVSTLELVDHDRDDPWTPGRARSIPVTVTYPAGFATGGTRSLPVVLFSPGLFGHSIGGATTTQVLLDDPRVDAGVNVDGALLYANTASPIVSQDPGTPLLSMLNSRHAENPEGRARFWGQYFATPRSWSKVYALRDTGHFSFTDAEHHVPQAIPDPPGMDVPAGFSLGTAPRQEVVDTTNHLVAGMFDRFLKEAPAPELDDAASRYPLVFEVR